MTAVSIEALTVVYNGNPALDGVTLEVPSRAWVALVGPNGAGKSTLLRAVAGLVAYAGTISLGDQPTADMARRLLSRSVAYLPQRPVLPEGATVVDYVAIGRTPHIPYWGMESPRDHEVVRSVLEKLELTALAHRHVVALSGGEAQRAVLARALAQEAEVLLLDEPISALDIGHQQQVMELIDRLRSEQGLTVLSALHDLTVAAQYAEILVMLSGGTVVSEGSARTVLTEERIRENYDARVRVTDGEATGLTVVPLRAPPTRERG